MSYLKITLSIIVGGTVLIAMFFIGQLLFAAAVIESTTESIEKIAQVNANKQKEWLHERQIVLAQQQQQVITQQRYRQAMIAREKERIAKEKERLAHEQELAEIEKRLHNEQIYADKANKEMSFKEFYHKAAECDQPETHEIRVKCANAYISAKAEFEKAYNQ